MVRGLVLGKAHSLIAAFVEFMLGVIARRGSCLMLLMHRTVFHAVLFVSFVSGLLCATRQRHCRDSDQCPKNAFHRFLSSSLCSLRFSPGDISGEIALTLSG